ncbi:MAG: hypothetical protein P1V20_12465 [Verrucomicrobiales bacterium]|nr:hypothetical protein [Verrucomicrobiales bacterium]
MSAYLRAPITDGHADRGHECPRHGTRTDDNPVVCGTRATTFASLQPRDRIVAHPCITEQGPTTILSSAEPVPLPSPHCSRATGLSHIPASIA